MSNADRMQERHATTARPPALLRPRLPALLSLLCSALAIHEARAVDGCTVLLCLAAPSWRSIPECVPTIDQLHRDLARGKPFPVCSMAGNGNSADHAWASAPLFCPPQYVLVQDGEGSQLYSCTYAGAITVTINGAPFTRTWWSMDGDSVTEFSPYAKEQLGTWDARFDDDYAAWLDLQPPPSPPSDSGY